MTTVSERQKDDAWDRILKTTRDAARVNNALRTAEGDLRLADLTYGPTSTPRRSLLLTEVERCKEKVDSARFAEGVALGFFMAQEGGTIVD